MPERQGSAGYLNLTDGDKCKRLTGSWYRSAWKISLKILVTNGIAARYYQIDP